MKGEVEQALERMGFHSLDILQPELLLGWRRNDVRPVELLASAFMPLVNPFMGGSRMDFRAISARTVCGRGAGRLALRPTRRVWLLRVGGSLRQLAELKPASPALRAQTLSVAARRLRAS